MSSGGEWDWCRDCGGRITMGEDGWYHSDNRVYATVPHVPEPPVLNEGKT